VIAIKAAIRPTRCRGNAALGLDRFAVSFRRRGGAKGLIGQQPVGDQRNQMECEGRVLKERRGDSLFVERVERDIGFAESRRSSLAERGEQPDFTEEIAFSQFRGDVGQRDLAAGDVIGLVGDIAPREEHGSRRMSFQAEMRHQRGQVEPARSGRFQVPQSAAHLYQTPDVEREERAVQNQQRPKMQQ